MRIASQTEITTELDDAYLTIDDETHINRNVRIDYTGGLSIGKHVTISEDAIIYTHDHYDDPRSPPTPHQKQICDNVWIGARSIILARCKYIAAGSIIGAGSIVTRDITEPSIVAGNPAKLLRKLT